MITGEEYVARLKKMRPNVYMDGRCVDRLDDRLVPAINVVRLSYDLAALPEHRELMTASSHLDGRTVNRFTHIHQSVEDLMKKQDLTRFLTRKTGFCVLRCMGTDAMNALSVVTRKVDDARGTGYHRRFLDYLRYWQEHDIVGSCAQTDTKGDRSRRPAEQEDEDMYVHVVERREDGIVVRGAKMHITTAPMVDELIVLPTRAMRAEDADYAVAFAVPADAEGVYLINRATAPRARRQLDSPLSHYGTSDCVVVFDNVFVPWERVFLCGEHEFGGELALMFALYHRHSYTGCKPAVTDVMMGLTALAAEYNGIERAAHVKEKLASLVSVAELVYGAGVAAAAKSTRSASGTQVPDPIFCNVGRKHAGKNIYHEHEILCEIAGGLPATLPYEADFYAEKTGDLLHKYMARRPGVSSEDQHRCFRCITDMSCSSFGGVWQYAGVHGGGSPIMEDIAILSSYNMEERKKLARHLAGIQTGDGGETQ